MRALACIGIALSGTRLSERYPSQPNQNISSTIKVGMIVQVISSQRL